MAMDDDSKAHGSRVIEHTLMRRHSEVVLPHNRANVLGNGASGARPLGQPGPNSGSQSARIPERAVSSAELTQIRRELPDQYNELGGYVSTEQMREGMRGRFEARRAGSSRRSTSSASPRSSPPQGSTKPSSGLTGKFTESDGSLTSDDSVSSFELPAARSNELPKVGTMRGAQGSHRQLTVATVLIENHTNDLISARFRVIGECDGAECEETVHAQLPYRNRETVLVPPFSLVRLAAPALPWVGMRDRLRLWPSYFIPGEDLTLEGMIVPTSSANREHGRAIEVPIEVQGAGVINIHHILRVVIVAAPTSPGGQWNILYEQWRGQLGVPGPYELAPAPTSPMQPYADYYPFVVGDARFSHPYLGQPRQLQPDSP